MTMAEALEHEWLAGPSSQHSESQPQALGGDSVWEINSFDNDDEEREDDLFTNNGDAMSDDGRWTRPATVSGTNMESAIGGGSDESFSQPMNNLRLTTPGIPRSNLSAMHIQNGDSVRPHEASPPSPPLTDEPMLVDPIPPLDITRTTRPPLLSPGASELGHIAPNTQQAHKRKYDPGVSAFSSGSLSPPPPGSDESQTKDKPDAQNSELLPTPPENGRVTRGAERATQSPGTDTTPMKKGATRKKATTAGQATMTAQENGTRTSPRRSNRPRKSMRLS